MLTDAHTTARDPKSDTAVRSGRDNDSDDEDELNARNKDNTNSEFSKFKSQNVDVKKVLSGRIQLENLGGQGKPTEHKGAKTGAASAAMGSSDPRANRNKAERILDCAAVLMSRQLRGICEQSLNAMAALFDQLNNPVCADYSIFSVNMKLRKISKKEITTDFADPVEVCLYPDLNDFKNGTTACLRQIVSASRDFMRGEQVIGSNLFGGANASFLSGMKQRKMNDSSVTLNDEIFVNNNQAIHANLVKYYAAPFALLEKFKALETLFSGELARKVSKAIDECIGVVNTGEALEQLTAMCADLDAMIEIVKVRITQ